MIKKGLKVGDTFVDGKLLYKITSFDPQGNYISSLVGKAGEEIKAPKAKEEEKAIEPIVKETTSLEDMPYSDLKKLAKEQGVSAKGSKEEVIERLRGI